MHRFLFQVFGKQVALLFGAVCFLSVAVLSMLYLTSSYALKSYVEEQIERIPWDVAALQRSQMQAYPAFQTDYRNRDNVDQVEALGFLRVQRGNGRVEFEIDGRPLPARWIGIIGTSDERLWPTKLRESAIDAAPLESLTDALPVQVALVAASSGDGDLPSYVRAGSQLRLYTPSFEDGKGHDHGHVHASAGEGDLRTDDKKTVFEAMVANHPAQIERQEFNKWMLRNVGSLSFLPEQSVVVAVPMVVYEQLAETLDAIFANTEGTHGVHGHPQYLPELTHLLRLERAQWVSPWELQLTIDALTPFLRQMLLDLRYITPYATVNSDLLAVVSRMEEISGLIGLVTLLVAIPLLCLAWVVAKLICRLVLLNTKRRIGLTLIRGVPVKSIKRSLMLALVCGGIAGGLLGLVAGIGLPVLWNLVSGNGVPTSTVISENLIYFLGFLTVGVFLGVMSGREMTRAICAMTPREAISRVESREPALGKAYMALVLVALVLGTYKISSWMIGKPLLVGALGGDVPQAVMQTIALAELALNFLGIPLLLFGVAGLLRLRAGAISRLLTVVVAPFVGRLRWFVSEHMAIAPYRTTATMFVTALAVALALSPQIASDTFEHRIFRGVQTSVGGDLKLEFDLVDLANGRDVAAPVAEYQRDVASQLAAIADTLRAHPRVRKVSVIQQYLVPGFYLPTQSALALNLLESPADYVNTVYYEEGIGNSAPFSEILAHLSGADLIASRGLLKVRKIPRDRDVVLGYDVTDDSSISGRFHHAVAFLPGQPSIAVEQREGYAAAELDYLNHTFSTDARIIADMSAFQNGALASLNVLPSSAVFLVSAHSNLDQQAVQEILAALPMQPREVRSVAEEHRRTSADMFVSLALANMKVFMFGGLIMAIIGVIVVGFTNFIAERRTFALLRLRGVPRQMQIRISLSTFLAPVLIGIVLGSILGTISGYGLAQAIWEVPRVYGVAGFLQNDLKGSATAVAIVLTFALILCIAATVFALMPFRRSAREAIREQ